MRKLICFLLCIIFCLGLSFGCSITSQNTQSTSELESEKESEIESTPIQEEKSIPKGMLSLQEAFDLGVLTHEDLLSIAYHSGNAQINEEIDGDFEPSAKPEMTEDVVLDITSSLSYAFNYLDLIPDETTADDFSVIDCFAFINSYYVLDYSCSFVSKIEEEQTEIVDGIKFESTYPIKVVQQKKMFMVTEAKHDYYEWWVKVIAPNSTQERVGVTVYGIFGGCLIGGFIDKDYFPQYGTYINVLGYEFWVNAGDCLYLWKDGEFYDIKWAYENGWITMENIAQAHETYRTGKGEEYR